MTSYLPNGHYAMYMHVIVLVDEDKIDCQRDPVININVTFGDYICESGGLIDSSPALGVVYVVSVWSPW